MKYHTKGKVDTTKIMTVHFWKLDRGQCHIHLRVLGASLVPPCVETVRRTIPCPSSSLPVTHLTPSLTSDSRLFIPVSLRSGISFSGQDRPPTMCHNTGVCALTHIYTSVHPLPRTDNSRELHNYSRVCLCFFNIDSVRT